jgi:hypothetical protein
MNAKSSFEAKSYREAVVVTHMSDYFCAWWIGEIHVRPMLCKHRQSAEADFFSSLVEKSVACAAVMARLVLM